MECIVTERAEEQIRKLASEPIYFRIDLRLGGGCSANVIINLTLDEVKQEDVVFEKDGLTILASPFTKDYIGDKVKLDYNMGFRLQTPNETLGYGLPLKRPQKKD